jgi:cysteine-S-conjugate beta-lyase
MTEDHRSRWRVETQLSHLGRDPEKHQGASNVPVFRVSTIVFPTVEDMEAARADRYNRVTYGSWGTPTSFALEDAVARLEGGYRAIATPTGVAALAAGFLAALKGGDHILISDGAYGPVRALANGILSQLGVETTFYDPRIGSGIEALMRPTTRLVYVESPSSLTFEIQDVRAISTVAHQHDALVMCDNSWATPLFFRSFDHGADLAVHAATKYLGGHSDCMLGILVTNEVLYETARATVHHLGYSASPDDVYLSLRGLRTLDVRLRRHYENGIQVAKWLQGRPQVQCVLHPALPDHPDHVLWKKQFSGASGLFGLLLKPAARTSLLKMLNGMKIFALGASWGGYESLIRESHPAAFRSATPWNEEGALLRLHVGLEHPEDLILDLERGLDRLSQ